MERMFTIYALKELKEVVQYILHILNSFPKSSQATILALYGELGAGKTTLVQILGKQLGIEEVMISPTFILERVYPISFLDFSSLVHIDAYRLENTLELDTINFSERLGNPQNLMCIEWAEKIPEVIPVSAVKISISAPTPTKREVLVSTRREDSTGVN